MRSLGPPLRFGVEEEYMLLHVAEGHPVDRAAELVRATPELGELTEREFFSSQLETATPVCETAAEAEDALERFRSTVARAATTRGIVLAGTGLPPVGGDTAGTVTPKPRYRVIRAAMREAAAYQYATGTHVHVEIPSPDAGVDVLARLARWAPTLLALTANSPIWCGEPTGFASWRHVMGLSWPVSGYPLGLRDADDYRSAVDRIVELGILPDRAVLTWIARLSERYPTIELRLADAQLTAADAVSFAAIVRALVERALREGQEGAECPRPTSGLVNGALWLAARDGLNRELVDPFAGESVPAFELVERMLATVEAELDRSGDTARVAAYLDRLRETGGPARRQLEAFEVSGITGLLELYRVSSGVLPGEMPMRDVSLNPA